MGGGFVQIDWSKDLRLMSALNGIRRGKSGELWRDPAGEFKFTLNWRL